MHPSSPPRPAPSELQVSKPKSSGDFANRLVFTLLMAYSFLALVSKGAGVMIVMVMGIMAFMFREVVRINQLERKDRQVPMQQFLCWWFLGVTLFVASAYHIRDPLLATYPWLKEYYNRFGLFTFSMYMFGLVAFVLSLKRGMYRYQFRQFTWMVMTLIFIVLQGSLQVANMLRGMIWFLVPIYCVVSNDIWAYCFGKSFGRTPLLSLSPKKTVEGFVGAWLFTMISGVWVAGFLAHFPSLTCAKEDFLSELRCTPHPLFVFEKVAVPHAIAAVSGVAFVRLCPMQTHALVMSIFASLLAPFGGFFASGLKRAFKLKDFGDLIPGHGGMTDRMDCQLIMGLFVYVYLQTYIFSDTKCPNPNDLLLCFQQLSAEGQQRFLEHVQAMRGG